MSTFRAGRRALALGGLMWLSIGCGDRSGAGSGTPPSAARRGAPPPSATARAGVCDAGGGVIRDEVTAKLVPRVTGGFCLDPNEPVRTFGEAADHPLDDICNLFDGECDVYKGFRVVRVAQIRWVSGKGGAATIDAYLSRFASPEDAYGMFTKRVVGDGDPADPATPSPIPGGGAAALGIGNALLWRGPYLVELTYNDDAAVEATLRSAGKELLPPLVAAIGEALPGEPTLPDAARALPPAHRLPMGVRWVRGPLFPSAPGVTDAAVGYYAEGAKRYRVAILARGDEAQAKDAMRALGQLPGAKKEKGLVDPATAFSVEESSGLTSEWVFARRGASVIGVGDEVRVLRGGESPTDRAAKTLDQAEKIERLKGALGG